jgi:hypothetical protein
MRCAVLPPFASSEVEKQLGALLKRFSTSHETNGCGNG